MTSRTASTSSTDSLPPASSLLLPQQKETLSSSNAEDFSEEQLSNDLAAFLTNPSLKAALADGSLDLASYSSTVENELAELETKCVQAYREKTEEIASLAKELENCDGILLGLQEMLLGFQADLGGLSGDIRQLQETSKSLNPSAAALRLCN